jgi:DUF4097 and DUF4098 domain-containing protein YvlB
MINTNIKSSQLKIKNLYKSMFADIDDTSINFSDSHIEIKHHDISNHDSASLEIEEKNSHFIIRYWDGYSLAEIEESSDLNKALKIFKRLAKKMAKNLRRFSDNN